MEQLLGLGEPWLQMGVQPEQQKLCPKPAVALHSVHLPRITGKGKSLLIYSEFLLARARSSINARFTRVQPHPMSSNSRSSKRCPRPGSRAEPGRRVPPCPTLSHPVPA